MEFSGSETIKAPREKVFDFLTDPKNFSSGIPDIKKIEIISPEKFKVVAKLGISFIRGTFTIDFDVVEKERPSHARLKGHGTGVGSAVDMDIVVDLEEQDSNTILKWKADAKVSGMLASLGQRMLGSVAEKIAREIFENIHKGMEKC